MAEQYVGIDLHRRRWVVVRMTGEGQVLETVRIDNDPVALSLELAKAGPDPEVVLEATYGWYWAADLLQACGATVHLATRWASRCSATSGSRPTPATPPTWPSCCGWSAPTRCGLPRCGGCLPPTTRRSRCLDGRSARPWPATLATWRSRPSPGWARCWRRSLWPRSATWTASPARRGCAHGPGSPPVTASPTPPCAVAPSPNRAPGWCAGPRSRLPSGYPEQASRPPTSTASPTGAARASAASQPPAGCSP